MRPETIFVSATPAPWEMDRTRGVFVEQVIRPTGLIDPEVDVRPVRGQVDDLLAEILPEKTDAPGEHADFGEWTGTGHGTTEATRYLGRLIENVITAEPGTSNAVLNKAAFGVGGLVAAGQLDGDWAYEALLDAANDRGAGDPEEVIQNSMASGSTKPWKFDPVDDEWIPVAAYRAFKQGKVPEPSPFPVDVLPPALAEFVVQGARSTSAPLDYVGAGILPVLGTAIGGNVTLRMKTGWSESTLLYVTLVGEPSMRKSPAMGLVMKPLYDAANAAYEEFQDRIDESGEEFAEVGGPDLFVDDATIEALFGVLQRSPRGVIMAADELDGWIRGMGQYKGGGGRDRQHWLSIWSRTTIKVDRKKAGSNYIKNPFVAILGGIQPDPLEELMHGKNDGLLPRLLMAQGEYVMPFFHDDDMDDAIIAGYADLWNDMRDAGMSEREVQFTPAGKEAFRSWVNGEHYPSIRNVPAELAAAWGKMDGQAARLCLILASLDGTEVTPDVVDRAVALVRYFEGQAGGILQGTTGGSRWEKQYAGRVKTIARFLQDNPAADRTEIMMHGPEWAMDGRLIDRILDDLPEGLWHG
jgi:hypothetical protein